MYVVVRERIGEKAQPCDEPWLAGSPEAKTAFQDVARRYPTIEEAGCRICVGMATGKNSVFVRARGDVSVEEDLLAPAVATRDLYDGGIRWRGLHVIKTARPDGRPWTRHEKPRLYRYLDAHRRELESRYHVQNRGGSWRMTLVPFDQKLAEAPKVLVAETAKPCRVSLDEGGHMPLNSLHAITSTEWPLDALAAILSAGAVGLVAHAFKLGRNGGHLRVNATALRRVRIPRWVDLSAAEQGALASGRPELALEASARIYGLNDDLLRMCAATDGA